MNVKKRLALTLGGLAVLTAECLFVRIPLLGLHGMKQWPLMLFAAGVIAVIVAGALGAVWPVAGALAGYLTGFACGLWFQAAGTDPGGGRSMNGWLIWGGVFLVFLLLGWLLAAAKGRRTGC